MPLRPSGRSPRQPTTPIDSPFLRQMRATLGTQLVTVIRHPGTSDEESFETEAHIQGNTGSFDKSTPIYTGDYVEMADPRKGPGGVERRYVASATVLQSGPEESLHRPGVQRPLVRPPTKPGRWTPPARPVSPGAPPPAWRRLGHGTAPGHVTSASDAVTPSPSQPASPATTTRPGLIPHTPGREVGGGGDGRGRRCPWRRARCPPEHLRGVSRARAPRFPGRSGPTGCGLRWTVAADRWRRRGLDPPVCTDESALGAT